jgi:hypothetical protein
MSAEKIIATRLILGIIATMLILSVISISLSNNNNILAFAQRPFGFGPFGENRFYTFGTISSIQNDNNGNPAWILTGFWKTNLINQTQTNGANLSGSVFNTSFKMVMTNGSGAHTHTITDFVLKNKSMTDKNTLVFNGTSAVSLREGIVTNIPTSIKIINNSVISIWLDPGIVKNHYGNTPIFGVVFKRDIGAPNVQMPMR